MKKRTTSAKKKTKAKKKLPEAKALSVEDLIRDADAALEEAVDVERAASLYTGATSLLRGKLALQVGDAHTNAILLANVLGKLGEIKVSMGDPEGAREDFVGALAVLPGQEAVPSDDWSAAAKLHEARAGLCLYLGQVSAELEALESYKKGVKELEACLQIRERDCRKEAKRVDAMEIDESDDEAETSVRETRRQLSCAYCSIAELYLTDLCYEENAEVECEVMIQSALRIQDDEDGKPYIDAFQAMANLRLSQKQAMDATQNILEAYCKMKTGCEALAALVGMKPDDEGIEATKEAVELVEVDAANSIPGFEFRCQTVKLLLECASVLKETSHDEGNSSFTGSELPKECSVAATQVVGSLLAENDEVIEVWFLAGCAYASMTPAKTELATQYFERALEMLRLVKENLTAEAQDEDDDVEDQVAEIDEQIEDITSKMQELVNNGTKTDSQDMEVLH